MSKTVEPIAVAGSMPGTDGFTMAVFEAAKVPVGTPLFLRPEADGKLETTSTTSKTLLALMQEFEGRAPFGHHEPGSPFASHRMLILHSPDIERLLEALLDAAVTVSRAERRAIVDGWHSGSASEPPEGWEPCSPEWLEAGGDCAKAPRVWSEKHGNHFHPKLAT